MTEFVTAEVAKGMTSGVNFKGKLKTKGQTRTVSLKRGGTANVCDLVFADDTDNDLDITLWGDDIEKAIDGCTIQITNGFINEFKGKKSLTKGKFGQLEFV